jgi:hypothetical protein
VRIKALVDNLPPGCEQIDLADLIAASEHDWQEPPVHLEPKHQYDWTASDRGSYENRAKLGDWISQQIYAPKKNARRLTRAQTRNRRR